jgi:hypothetical protein
MSVFGANITVEERYREHKVVVIGNSRQVSIYHKGKLIEVHDRITDPYISKSTKECHKAACWEITKCPEKRKNSCFAHKDRMKPCWELRQMIYY